MMNGTSRPLYTFLLKNIKTFQPDGSKDLNRKSEVFFYFEVFWTFFFTSKKSRDRARARKNRVSGPNYPKTVEASTVHFETQYGQS